MAFEASFYGGPGNAWAVIAIAAAAISVLGAAMLIMLSRLFGLRNLEQIAKTEFTYAASTVLIVIIILPGIIGYLEPQLAGGSDSIARALYLSALKCRQDTPAKFDQYQTLIDWMKLYLETPTRCVQRFMDILYALSVPVEAMTSVYMEIFMSEHASGFGVKWLAERITNATQSLSFYMYVYYIMVHILNFIKHYAGFFFSVGVALRAFPPTRGTGAYLMAISLGLYFVFPLSYIVLATLSLPHAEASITGIVKVGDTDTCEVDPQGALQNFCALPEIASPETYQCKGAMPGVVTEYVDRLRENADSLEEMATWRVNDFARHLVSAICLFPMVSLVILLTFVLNTTNLFGGNIPEIGRGLVKLI